MTKKSFEVLSIRARIAYAIMCFEEYVLKQYSNQDFSPVCTLMWNIVSDNDYIDESAYKYMEIIPEYLFEFDNYEDAEFEYLSKEDYIIFSKLLNKDDETLNIIMHRIYDIAMACSYVGFNAPAQETIDYTFDVIELAKPFITLPSVEQLSQYTYDESGWGSYIPHSTLSKIL